jgi:protein TonB
MNAALDGSPNSTLADFSRARRAAAPRLSDRAAALVLTAVMGGLLVLFATHRTWWSATQHPAPPEVVTQLMREESHKQALPPPPVPADLIRPRPETPTAPAFTVATETPPAPAQLPASAAKTSPMAGGSPAGTGSGTGAQGASGNGAGGNGTGQSSCWDPAWARAVTARVRRVFYFPRNARDQNVTGMVVIRMTVLRNGMLESLDIGKSSGNASLDEAAFNIMKKAQPLPRIPDRMHVDKVSALFPLFFGVADSSTDTAGNCKN